MGYGNDYNITIDIKKNITMINQVPQIVSGDTSTLFVKIISDGQEYDYSNADRYAILFKRPDGEVIIGEGKYEDGLIKYTLGTTEMRVAGTVETVIQLYLGDTRVTTRPFGIKIMKDYDDGIESSQDYTLLQNLFIEVDQVKSNTEQAAQFATEQGELAKTYTDQYEEFVYNQVENPRGIIPSFSQINTITNPQNGDTVFADDSFVTYRYNGKTLSWIAIRRNNGANVYINNLPPSDKAGSWIDTSS